MAGVVHLDHFESILSQNVDQVVSLEVISHEGREPEFDNKGLSHVLSGGELIFGDEHLRLSLECGLAGLWLVGIAVHIFILATFLGLSQLPFGVELKLLGVGAFGGHAALYC